MKYEKPIIEVLELKNGDIVRTSGLNNGGDDNDTEWEWV